MEALTLLAIIEIFVWSEALIVIGCSTLAVLSVVCIMMICSAILDKKW